jgi:ribosomal protein L17
LAENQREHYIENQRTKQYALSLIGDLKKDTGAFRVLKRNYIKDIIKIDTFRNMLKNISIIEIPAAALYYYCEPVIWAKGITFHDATIQQLKNSGNLRYFPAWIQNKISEYDRMTRELSARQENEIYFSRISRDMMTEIFDAESILTVTNLSIPSDVEEFKKKNISLIKKDTLSVKKLVNEIIYRQASWQFRLKQIIEPTNEAATELLTDLEKKYNME